jgi:hypothetical protein
MNNLDRPGFVYFARRRDGVIKVGHSVDPQGRLRQCASWVPPLILTLEHTIATNRAAMLEHALHQRYAEFHLKGEWFSLPAAELQIIRSVRRVRVTPGMAFTTTQRDGSPCLCRNKWKAWEGRLIRGRPPGSRRKQPPTEGGKA